MYTATHGGVFLPRRSLTPLTFQRLLAEPGHTVFCVVDAGNSIYSPSTTPPELLGLTQVEQLVTVADWNAFSWNLGPCCTSPLYGRSRVLPTGALSRPIGEMEMNEKFKEVLGTLKELQGQIRGDDYSGASEKIGEVIEELERLAQEHHSEDRVKELCFQAIGVALKYVPAIAALIESIKD